ncbi:MAG: flagellar hook assembly protein FlgD [Proteobacteria bacterium]|nr:flagellar hook assembly protein FlgD [Pseudomonadota bacterium]
MQVNGMSSMMSNSYDVKKMGKQDFLKLFVAQLQYQNPLEPLKNEDFIAQLAQFSSLEELGNIREEISKLSMKDNSNPFIYANLIGKTVKYGYEGKESKVIALNLKNDGLTFKLENGLEIGLQDILEIK